uniref:uncharacterized protein LOC124060274 n=1 Tax=Scatophagus argus TaxID=75038 RepID=UPI001ED83522|nr:uncharacterized protein LOC124060274 [Scatophagus argus]
MGNVATLVKNFSQFPKRHKSYELWRNEPEVVQEAQLLSELLELQEVELWRVHWCLSKDLQQEFPPIPRHWFRFADAQKTAKIMLRCYHEEGALMMLEAALTAINYGGYVHHLHHHVEPPIPRLPPTYVPDFVKTQRRNLIRRIQWLDAIFDTLQDYGILNAANREAINIYGVHKEKNRALVDLVLKKGGEAQEVFHKVLSQSEPFLLQELEDDRITEKDPSESSFLIEMLDLLVSDELRSFQWLVSHLMAGDGRPPVGVEQLQHADRPTTERILRKHFGPKQVESVAMNILLKIVPTLSVCLRGETVTSQRSSDITGETNLNPTVVDITPQVSEDGGKFRLRCQQPGVYRCSLTGLLLEGVGDVVYQMVPWDLDFLSSKGLRPAGPLFRFTLLTGIFHRLHLPHCQLLSGDGQHFLSVAHVTGDSVDFITPGQVTDSHVIISVSGFSCFGLLTRASSNDAIGGLVLPFYQPSHHSLFVLLLPRNICLTKVIKEWKQRSNAEYVETIANCELIPNQMYKLSVQPDALVHPQSSKFVNFSDYNNFLASFHVQLAADVNMVELHLRSHEPPQHVIGWLFGSTESVVWNQHIILKAAASSPSTEVCASESTEVTTLLLNTLNSLGQEDFQTFKHRLRLQPDPIPNCRLEAAERTKTVDLMVQQYHTEGAKNIAENILRKMKYNQLADVLHRR